MAAAMLVLPPAVPADAVKTSNENESFSDCEKPHVCPEMVAIPASSGQVSLGTIDPDEPEYHEKRLLKVSLKPFAIGKFEVSVKEYSECVQADACKPPEWLEDGSQFHIETGRNNYYRRLGNSITNADAPIVGVSWIDAQAYTLWLSKVTGQHYRLPSDAEWEYAARAGSKSAFWWGETPRSDDAMVMAACRGCGSAFDGQTLAAVTAFQPNPWGLHNVHGNVWEWVADFYCDAFRTSPADGRPRDKDDCAVRDAADLHVLRGGSSFYEPSFMRSSKRLRNTKSFRNFSVGFRVARSLGDQPHKERR